MKKIFLLSLILISPIVVAFSQTNTNENDTVGLLFPKFEKGTVIHKDGGQSKALLNYNTILEEMLFKDDKGETLRIANPADIAIININGRKFEYSGHQNIFYELINVNNELLYLKLKSKILPKGKAAAYGNYSQTTSSESVNYIFSSQDRRGVFLNVDQKIDLVTDYTYFLKVNGKFRRIDKFKHK